MVGIEGTFHFDTEINDLIKAASAAARENNYDAAIEIMKDALEKIYCSDGSYSFSTYVKILPYFQKAGRYGEAIKFADKELIPKLVEDYDKSTLTEKAFICLYVGKVFEKLALNAKRANKVEDEVFFTGRAREMEDSYLKLIDVGKTDDLKREFKEAIEVFGEDHNCWPEVLKRKFQPIIGV
ncbi:hypothetical protein DFP83_101483 [Idiomarina fontislapidosi]|uniref:Tetratricopeptide repeat protein n=1 Tax=Idiomarina fontislapidosi TaxID=263723 RepID=A0A432YC11_9GAMM|nr:hypothetical protein [Idiomarina fontislapidosi]PYE35594.1 hypothetical protein DFP83_101483 [Idiomarina fontislapidosi]RUO58467.1 hypothetical protein CWE25_02430 [Idiomarina fontislapidosi]